MKFQACLNADGHEKHITDTNKYVNTVNECDINQQFLALTFKLQTDIIYAIT